MKKLTEKKTIEKSITLWQWLYENPRKCKKHYPEYEDLIEYHNYCYCCEYYMSEHNAGCRACPLEDKEYCCEGEGDAFTDWMFNVRRKKSAKIIHDRLAEFYTEKWGRKNEKNY